MLERWLGISLGVIVLDQLTKLSIVGLLDHGQGIVVTPFFNLVSARNTGAAFSFLAGAGGWQRYFFIVLALAASAFIVYLLRRHAAEKRFSLGLALILGGAVGNLIDRVRLGYVIDFLDFHYAGWHYPAFNVADSAITVGAALVIWDGLAKSRRP